MSKNDSLLDGSPAHPTNQNNQTSDDPGDGRRLTDKPEAHGQTPAEKVPANDAQNQATIEDFGREGMGVSGKE